ncbi:MAG: glycosyltransferase family 39 protein [Kiritimatiellae bacterium]|nr:glycosyltransferase family 39 protein [Kiritimatiellia bacterium]
MIGIVAFLILGAAAIWFGGLNQDEGWYLYAANLVSEGLVPFVDFDFTQGPIMPYVYAAFSSAWKNFGLLGARVVTLSLGALGIMFSALTARRLADEGQKKSAFSITFLLLAVNLYHVYYLTIPKTYALASLFIAVGFYLLTFEKFHFLSGVMLALAGATRFSLAALLVVIAIYLFIHRRIESFNAFIIGAIITLGAVFGWFMTDFTAEPGLLKAIGYHAAREGFSPVMIVGSLSRLVRFYLPIFIVLGLGDFKRSRFLALAFAVVFLIHLFAPHPYEDYQVPIMSLLAVFAAINIKTDRAELMTLGLALAISFGSPLLEKWTSDGQDRFWTIMKPKSELAMLREAAREIEALDPEGTELLTEDTYLAVETNRHVPRRLAMGPFSDVDLLYWKELLEGETAKVAAFSGYAFAIEVPKGNERSLEEQLATWELVKDRYVLASTKERFGQNSTTLLILKKKE